MIRTYDLLYLKRSTRFVVLLFLPVSLLFLVVSLLYDAYAYDWIFSLCIVPCAVILNLLVFFVFLLREHHILKTQSRDGGFLFHDRGARPLHPTYLIFISDEWLIVAGRLALHKDYIRSITAKPQDKRNPQGGYNVFCNCQNGKRYRFFCDSPEDVKTIKKHFQK